MIGILFNRNGSAITMKCPKCGFPESKVVDSRPTDDGQRIRRRRECMQCAQRFTTYESIETQPLVIIKKDKSRQVFDRNKLLSGMLRACEKRPVDLETLERAIDDIETRLQNSLEREITSVEIGEMALEKLRDIDEIAYVRFASVYRDFKDIESFSDALNMLKKKN